MKQWLTLRYEDGVLTGRLSCQTTYGRAKRTITSGVDISAEALAHLIPDLITLIATLENDLVAQTEIDRARSVARAADMKEL